MKNKIKFIVFVLALAVVCLFNLNLSQSGGKKQLVSYIGLKNVRIMQASGGEVTCQNVNNVKCIITDGPIRGEAMGPVVGFFGN